MPRHGISIIGPICLLLAILVACGSGSEAVSPAQQPPSPQTPSSPAQPLPRHTVQGEVFAFETGMIESADINLWVQTGGFGYSYWWANGPLRSDAIGHFEATNLPDSQITILAHKDGYVQPCAVTSDIREDRAIRVEMIPAATLETLDPPRPQLSVEPSLTGVIFETTASGRQPVAGADLWAETWFEVGLATTRSDQAGGFFLCNLGTIVYLYVSSPGFEPQWIGPVDASESTILEIELNRL